MGIIKHETAIGIFGATQRDAIAEVTALQQRSGASRQLLLGPAEYYNGWVSFSLLPDGAKEGSEPSKEGDQIREAFLGSTHATGRMSSCWMRDRTRQSTARRSSPPVDTGLADSGNRGRVSQVSYDRRFRDIDNETSF